MAAKIYSCKNCGFIFTRVGECDQCPDCGKYTVRLANEKEIKEFEYRKSHPEDGWDTSAAAGGEADGLDA